uniref:Condensin-2 complex subunit H2 n=1 Tax=Panagrellus redivivus TaxID=6233 RepID=A0A7E4VZV2_PANRE
MIDLEIDDDFREKFAYLFNPITDFARGFEIDLIEVLRDYDGKTLEADTGFNFVNAASLLQGTINVYGKRIDILHKAVSTFTDPALEKERRKQAAARTDLEDDVVDKVPDEIHGGAEDDAVQEPVHADTKKSRLNTDDESYSVPADRTQAAEDAHDEDEERKPSTSDFQPITKIKLPERLHRNIASASLGDNNMITRDCEEGLCIFDRFNADDGAHSPMYITMKREYSLMYTMPGNMMPLVQGEKRPVELLDANGMKYGDVDDYRMCRDYVVYNFSIFSNLGGSFCYEIKEDHCAGIAEQLQQYLRSANGNQLPEGCLNDIERTLETDMKRGRPSHHLIELCRRISDGPTHRYSEGTELERVYTPAPMDDISYGDFEPIDFDDGDRVVGDSVQPEGRVTRASRQSRRLTAQTAATRVEFNDGTFREADLYAPDEFSIKPVELVRRMKTSSRKAIRLRQLRRCKSNGREPLLVEEIADYFAYDCKEVRAALEKNMIDNNISWGYQSPMIREQKRRLVVQQELKRARLRGQRALRSGATSEFNDVPAPPSSALTAIGALEQSLHHFDNPDVYSFNNNTAGSFIGDQIPMKYAMDNDVNASFHFPALNETVVETRSEDKENMPPVPIVDVHDDATDYVDVHDEGLEFPDTDALLFADLPENSTIQNVVRVFLNRKWNMALKKQPECAVKLAKWERKMHPILTNLTDDFAAHNYGSKALDCFDGNIGKTLCFEGLAEGSANERSRYLLSLLMLSNRNAILLHSAHDGVVDKHVDVDDVYHKDFKVELLSDADWHGNEMNQSGLI